MAATEYWSRHLRSVLAPLLAAAETYSPADQESHLTFIDEHVAPNLGPLPWEPHGQYSTPSSLVGSPFDPSLNLVSSGKAKVRFDFDIISPASRNGPDPFAEKSAKEILHRLANIVGADTRWMNTLMDALYLSPEETEIAIAKMPPGVAVPPSSVGFDFDGPERTLKFYIPCVRKALATGQEFSDLMLKTLRGLEPLGQELGPALDLIAGYLSTCNNDAMLPLVGIDCVDPTTHNARVKCYLHTSSNSFAVVRDVLTLGGRLNDPTSIKRVEILKSIWPLLINELEGPNSDSDTVDESWSKPERINRTGYSGIQYTVEITPGKAIPDTKIYVPLFQYTDSSEVAERNFESVLRKLGNEWGGGRYREVMQGIFKDVGNYGQTYASFSYTEEKGVYTTSYVAMPIKDDGGGGGLAGEFGFRE
ncbi:hypothetical protein BDV12DRAFT_198895 [Aspergillus spectabilis]